MALFYPVCLFVQNKAEQLHSAVFGGDPRKVQRDQERDAHFLRYIRWCLVMVIDCCVLSDHLQHTAYRRVQHMHHMWEAYGQAYAQHAMQRRLAALASTA